MFEYPWIFRGEVRECEEKAGSVFERRVKMIECIYVCISNPNIKHCILTHNMPTDLDSCIPVLPTRTRPLQLNPNCITELLTCDLLQTTHFTLLLFSGWIGPQFFTQP
jgi:hypothetical protein